MSRVLINTAIFLLGLCLAFGFVRYSKWLELQRLPRTVSLEKIEFPSTRLTSKTLTDNSYALASGEVSFERRIRLYENAVHGKTAAQMSLLNAEELRAQPKYRSLILPRLKLLTLQVLMERFTEADWRTWPIGALDLNRKPTDARRYVDSLWQVNADLASFAETAAYLLHGMFSSIANGKPYPLQQDLQFLMMNAKDVLSSRRSAARDVNSAFDATLLQDPSIYLSFERVRAELSARFIAEHPYQREAQFALLLDLDPRTFTDELREELKRSLQTLALNASADYRAEVLPAVVDSRLLSLLAAEDRKVARALSQLYLVGSVDAIEAGRLELAERLLLRSESTYSGLKAQGVLARFITEQKQNQIETAAEPAMPRVLELDEQKSVSTPSAKAEIGWFTMILLALLVFAVLYGIRIVLERRSSARVSGGLRDTKNKKTAAVKKSSQISDPSALDFDSEGIEDVDFDLSVVNR